MIQKEAYLPLRDVLNREKTRKQLYQLNLPDVIDEILLLLSCFIIGRAVIFGSISPFGVALFGVLLSRRWGSIAAFLAVGAGICSNSFSLTALKYISSMGLLIPLINYTNKKNRQSDGEGIILPFSVLISLLIVNTIHVMLNGFLLYYVFLGIFESIIGFIMVYVFFRVVNVYKEKLKRRILSGEEIICISIFLSLLVIGFWDIGIAGLSIRRVLSIFLILLSAYIGGAGVGASIGITIGFILSFSSSPDPVLIANLAVCGLMAGTFKQLGKIGSGLAFLLANILMTFYINYSTFVILPFKDIIASVILLAAFPQKAVLFLKQFLDYTFVRAREQQYYVKRMQELTVGRLKEFARVFHHLSRAFGRISDKGQNTEQEQLLNLFDTVADEVCIKCILYKNCWERDFAATYTSMVEMLNICEKKDKPLKDTIPVSFNRRCFESVKFAETLSNAYKDLMTNLRWQEQIDDCRQLVAEQLNGISKVVSQLASEINMDIRFKSDIEDHIKLELDKKGIRVREVLVLEKTCSSLEVSIAKAPCRGGLECLNIIEKTVSEALNRPMSCSHRGCTCGGKDICVIRLMEARQFEVLTGVARRAKEHYIACGDSYSFSPVKDGKYMLAISDGMGSGARAQEESSSVIALLENFLEAGFGQDIAIKTINSILILRSREEMYATADLCILDLINATADFIKIGGVPTFIRRGDKVEIIEDASLPIGILDDVNLKTMSIEIKDEDMIVMMTDGILDAFSTDENGRDYLIDLIGKVDTKNPQELADCIMEQALNYTDGIALDDMTVMVARIWRKVC